MFLNVRQSYFCKVGQVHSDAGLLMLAVMKNLSNVLVDTGGTIGV